MENKGIYAAIPAIMAELGPIKKDKFNKQQNYQFRGIDDCYQALQPLLAKHKVFIVPQFDAIISENERVTKTGGLMKHIVASFEFEVCHADGSLIKARTLGEAMDSGDKASNKAMSTAMKYAILQLFCVPTEDLEDSDSSSPEMKAPQNFEQKCAALAKTNSKQITTPKKTESNTGHLNSPIDSASFIWAWGPKKGTPLSSFTNDELNSAINWLNSWDKSTPLQQKAIEHIENILGS